MSEPDRQRGYPGWPARVGHLAALWAFGVAQPLFSEFEGFVLVAVDRLDLIVFALVTIALPILLVVPELILARVSRPAAWYLHLAFIAVLGMILVSQILANQWSPSSEVQAPIAVLAGAAIAALYRSLSAIRDFLTVLSPAPLVFAAIFLLAGNGAPVVLGSEREEFPRQGARPVPVVLLILDELPTSSLLDAKGAIDARNFPNFADLASRATWFRNAITVQDSTLAAVPAILSGRLRGADVPPVAAQYPDSVFSLLASSHRINALESVSRVCPDRLCHTLGSFSRKTRWRRLLDVASRLSGTQWLPPGVMTRLFPVHERRGNPGSLLSYWSRGLRGRAPGLHMHHVMLPHQPWRFYPSGRQYTVEVDPLEALGPVADDRRWPASGVVAAHAYQRHLLQLGYADRLLGRLLSELRRTRLYERSLVVVVADHGVSFRPRQHPREIATGTAADIGAVPLFVKLPDQEKGRISDRLVRTVDVLPTIAAVLGAKPTGRLDGRSVFRASKEVPRSVRVKSQGGDVEIATRSVIRTRDATVARKAALFGDHLESLFGLGPAAELVGRRVAPRSVRLARGSHVSLGSVPPTGSAGKGGIGSGRLSGRLHGRLARAGTPLAVAVAGQIVATTAVETSRGEPRFAAMLPELALAGSAPPVVLAPKRRNGRWTFSVLPTR